MPIATALKAFHACFGNSTAKERIFASPFHHTPPTRVASDVHHRGKRPLDTVSSCFFRSDGSSLLHQLQIPRAGFAKRHREDCLIAVYHIVTEEDRNAQAGFLYRYLLHLAHAWHGYRIEHTAY